jgi:diaminopimelate decarboxylase
MSRLPRVTPRKLLAILQREGFVIDRGPVCESGDFIALERSVVEPQPGDLLAIMSAGAYGAVQAGTYSTRALVPEVLVGTSEWALVRPRVSAEELIALDRLPPWL